MQRKRFKGGGGVCQGSGIQDLDISAAATRKKGGGLKEKSDPTPAPAAYSPSPQPPQRHPTAVSGARLAEFSRRNDESPVAPSECGSPAGFQEERKRPPRRQESPRWARQVRRNRCQQPGRTGASSRRLPASTKNCEVSGERRGCPGSKGRACSGVKAPCLGLGRITEVNGVSQGEAGCANAAFAALVLRRA